MKNERVIATGFIERVAKKPREFYYIIFYLICNFLQFGILPPGVLSQLLAVPTYIPATL
jgi:hypothetical protein